ncbi:hypothetical protein QTN25_004494 [Entamoeba marina]
MSSQREKVVNEIFSTEEFYTFSLQCCIDFFYKQMISDKNSSIIKKDDVYIIFAHFEEVLNVNKQFYMHLRSLKEKNELDTNIGSAFKKYIPFFKVYFLYILKAEKGTQLMAKYEQDQRYLDLIDSIQASVPTQTNLDLRSYLIMPVQRLPRYNLLLKELIQNTDENHPDYNNLNSAIEGIKEVTLEVNERVKDIERRAKVLKVQTLITGLKDLQIVEPNRAYVMEGMMIKVCKKANKPRYFYLFNDLLIYGIGNGKISVSEWFYLKNVFIDDADPKLNHAFVIRSDVKSFTVCCDTAEEKNEWVNAINKHAIIQRRNLGDSSAITRPVWVPDSEVKNCSLCNSSFTFVNRRHHCRKCGKCVCGNCSRGKIPLPPKNLLERVCTECFCTATGFKPEPRSDIKEPKSELISQSVSHASRHSEDPSLFLTNFHTFQSKTPDPQPKPKKGRKLSITQMQSNGPQSARELPQRSISPLRSSERKSTKTSHKRSERKSSDRSYANETELIPALVPVDKKKKTKKEIERLGVSHTLTHDALDMSTKSKMTESTRHSIFHRSRSRSRSHSRSNSRDTSPKRQQFSKVGPLISIDSPQGNPNQFYDFVSESKQVCYDLTADIKTDDLLTEKPNQNEQFAVPHFESAIFVSNTDATPQTTPNCSRKTIETKEPQNETTTEFLSDMDLDYSKISLGRSQSVGSTNATPFLRKDSSTFVHDLSSLMESYISKSKSLTETSGESGDSPDHKKYSNQLKESKSLQATPRQRVNDKFFRESNHDTIQFHERIRPLDVQFSHQNKKLTQTKENVEDIEPIVFMCITVLEKNGEHQSNMEKDKHLHSHKKTKTRFHMKYLGEVAISQTTDHSNIYVYENNIHTTEEEETLNKICLNKINNKQKVKIRERLSPVETLPNTPTKSELNELQSFGLEIKPLERSKSFTTQRNEIQGTRIGKQFSMFQSTSSIEPNGNRRSDIENNRKSLNRLTISTSHHLFDTKEIKEDITLSKQERKTLILKETKASQLRPNQIKQQETLFERNRRLFEERIQKQNENERRDYLLRRTAHK